MIDEKDYKPYIIRELGVMPLANYKGYIERLRKTKSNYNVLVNGKSIEVRFLSGAGLCDRYYLKDLDNKNEDDMSGLHLCRTVKANIISRIESGLYTMPNMVDYPNRLYLYEWVNPVGIEALGKGKMVGIDLNNCYWQTLYLIGAISEKQKEAGYKKSGWKGFRNMAIGNLAKNSLLYRYRDGEQVGRPEIITNKYAAVRMQVIWHVFEVFQQVANVIGAENYYRFYTDSLFVKPSLAKKVDKMVREFGYECKFEPEYLMGWRKERHFLVLEQKDRMDMRFCEALQTQNINGF